jgi:hypothetical protein
MLYFIEFIMLFVALQIKTSLINSTSPPRGSSRCILLGRISNMMMITNLQYYPNSTTIFLQQSSNTTIKLHVSFISWNFIYAHIIWTPNIVVRDGQLFLLCLARISMSNNTKKMWRVLYQKSCLTTFLMSKYIIQKKIEHIFRTFYR